MAEQPPRLRIGSFAAHSARGLVRERKTRRAAMLLTLVVALLMMTCGATFLDGALNAHEHPIWFLLYWLACGWLTTLALLLAAYDLLIVRRDSRAARETLRRQAAADARARAKSDLSA
ncbi:MAG: hypothetical protein ACJ8KU_11570 [Chthoniobacterales bacterium]